MAHILALRALLETSPHDNSLRAYDEALLRRAFDVARRSREAGDHPFGSVLADADGNLVMEQGNGYSSEGGDRTAHAERLLASRAARAYDLASLARSHPYTSAEPCAMCAGAIYWAGIGRVVYGQTREGAESADRRARGEPDARPAVRDRLFGPGSARPKSSGRCSRTRRRAAGRLLEDEGVRPLAAGLAVGVFGRDPTISRGWPPKPVTLSPCNIRFALLSNIIATVIK